MESFPVTERDDGEGVNANEHQEVEDDDSQPQKAPDNGFWPLAKICGDMGEQKKKGIDHHIAFNGEGGKAKKTEKGHLEKLHKPEIGDRVDPLGSCPKIPAFPEDPAAKPTHEKQAEVSGGPLLEIAQDRVSSVFFVNGFEQKNEAQPDQRKAYGGEKKGQHEQSDTHGHEMEEGAMKTNRDTAQVPEKALIVQEVASGQEGREHCRKGYGKTAPSQPPGRGEIEVMPVLQPEVESLKEQPKGD